MTKEQIQSLLNNGYNLNQIAAIHMISKETLQMTLDADACAPIIAKGKTKTLKTDSDVSWLNEENI